VNWNIWPAELRTISTRYRVEKIV